MPNAKISGFLKRESMGRKSAFGAREYGALQGDSSPGHSLSDNPLEPCAVKVARTVLRGEGPREGPDLPD